MHIYSFYIILPFTATPTGQVPYMTVDGKLLTQSVAIARYLAREFGKYLRHQFHWASVLWVTALLNKQLGSYRDDTCSLRIVGSCKETSGYAV